MKHIDDLFRDGLGGRKGEVPADLWNKINAAKPAGEALDKVFATALRDRQAPVPTGMWERIIAARGLPRRRALYLAAAVLLLLLGVGALWLTPYEPPVAPTRDGNTVVPASTPEPARGPATAAIDNSAADVPTNSPTGATETLSADTGSGERAPRQRPATAATAATTTTDVTSAAELQPATRAVPNEAAPPETTTPEALATPPGGRRTTAVASLDRQPTSAVVSLARPTDRIGTFDDRDYRPKVVPNGGFARAPRHRSQTEMLFGAAYANQLLTANSQADRALLSARENSEFPELSYQVTLRQAYRLTDRVTLRAGLTYLDIRNQLDYEEVVDGTLQLTRRNNHIRVLEVPVLVGLTIPAGRLRVTANVGPVFNLHTSVQGNFLDPESAEPLSLRENAGFRGYTGVGYTGSLMTTYAIGKKDPFVLVLEPFFKHYPGSFTQGGSRIRESYWLAGLQLGIRKSL